VIFIKKFKAFKNSKKSLKLEKIDEIQLIKKIKISINQIINKSKNYLKNHDNIFKSKNSINRKNSKKSLKIQ
jgi:ribosomal protein S4E